MNTITEFIYKIIKNAKQQGMGWFRCLMFKYLRGGGGSARVKVMVQNCFN